MDPAPGIIPARAGFTADRGRVPAAARDHPRSRGVYEFPDLQAAWEAGSSPLARGLQAVARDITAAARIIPARAGFTRDHRLRRPVGPDHPRSRGVYTLPYGSVLRRQGSSPLARGLRQPAAAGTLRPGIIPARAGFTPAGERPRWRGRDHPRSRGVYRATGKPVMLYAGSSPLARGLRHRYEGASAPAPDHPRSRGVYGKLPREALRSRGSSPLARGLPERQFFQHVVEGIIPARAGFTRHEPQNDRHTQDHPRSRGVYSARTPKRPSHSGSSPLARGLPVGEGGEPVMREDHPRSRGVYTSVSSFPADAAGSSPLARGLLLGEQIRRHVHRIIPARAGFTALRRPPSRTGRDHPRSRGVYVSLKKIRTRLVGSSPLARGLLRQGLGEEVALGIIPARAGFTPRPRRSPRTTPDHPRSRGVYQCPAGVLLGADGSSPLARGLRSSAWTPPRWRGIIPARAGFTCRRRCCRRPPRDHPRSRGVYVVAWFQAYVAPVDHPRSRGVYWTSCHRFDPALGSSPLARGLPYDLDEDTEAMRIIPARAGFTNPARRAAFKTSDHPRSRGVYAVMIFKGAVPSGIIPARAGFTRRIRGPPGSGRDHPRSRGVYTSQNLTQAADNGSSPLARGLRPQHPSGRHPRGIIPARAGFTWSPGTTAPSPSDHPRSRGVYDPFGRLTVFKWGSSPLARGLLVRR